MKPWDGKSIGNEMMRVLQMLRFKMWMDRAIRLMSDDWVASWLTNSTPKWALLWFWFWRSLWPLMFFLRWGKQGAEAVVAGRAGWTDRQHCSGQWGSSIKEEGETIMPPLCKAWWPPMRSHTSSCLPQCYLLLMQPDLQWKKRPSTAVKGEWTMARVKVQHGKWELKSSP